MTQWLVMGRFVLREREEIFNSRDGEFLCRKTQVSRRGPLPHGPYLTTCSGTDAVT